jgi:hypothetical protein
MLYPSQLVAYENPVPTGASRNIMLATYTIIVTITFHQHDQTDAKTSLSLYIYR